MALASCGDEEPILPDAVDRDDARLIAATINVVRDGLIEGDGQAVCGSLVAEGQRITVQVVTRDLDVPADSCEAAVEELAATLTARERKTVSGPRPYRAGDVDVDPTNDPGFNDMTDTVPEGGPTSIEVPCLEGDGNSWFATRQDDGAWKLEFPFCTGR